MPLSLSLSLSLSLFIYRISYCFSSVKSQIMHFRFFRTTYAFSLLPIILHRYSRQFSRKGKMNKAKKSAPLSNSEDRCEKVRAYGPSLGVSTSAKDAGGEQQTSKPSKSLTTSNSDMEWPSLSRNTKSDSKGKRGSKIDPRMTQVEQGSEDKTRSLGSLKPKTTTTIANFTTKLDESFSPTGSSKKFLPSISRTPTTCHTYPAYAVDVDKSSCTEGSPVIKPFDICLPKTRECITLKASLHETNRRKRNQMGHSMERIGQELKPGMVLLKGYLALREQVDIVSKCQELGIGPGGFYQPSYEDGAKLHLQMMCLGLNWDPQTKYGSERPIDHSKPPSIPDEFSVLVKRAIQDSHALIGKHCNVNYAEDVIPKMTPDICIVNFYTTSGRLGLHQDHDESEESLRRGLPVVSFSVGDSAEFLYGDHRDVDKAQKVVLESGDVLIFGGLSRHIFHGVTSIIPKSAPSCLLEEAKLRPGRLNLTFREF